MNPFHVIHTKFGGNKTGPNYRAADIEAACRELTGFAELP